MKGDMAEKRDYYEVLGVERSASPDEIKRSYRRQAIKYHPDNYKGDKTEGEARFKELAEAYEVLSDPDKRGRYDRFGHEGLRGSAMHDFSSMGFGDIFSMFEDIFSGMGFGFSGRRAGSGRGTDLETDVSITLLQAAGGVDRTLEFERMDHCETCGGSGAKAGTTPDRCATCGGYGQVRQQVRGLLGMSVRVVGCPDCNGKGSIVKDPCPDCKGTGRARKKRVLTVHIPEGIRDGQVVSLRGEGESGRDGASRGDLHVVVRVEPHPLLARRGSDIACEVPVSFTTAALGGKVEIPTLEGIEEINIPPGTQSGDVINLKKRGMPQVGGGRKGSLQVFIQVEVPKKLSRAQRKIVEQLAEAAAGSPGPKHKEYAETLKECYSPKKPKK
jgi:molecular chaperone DnaJ